MMRNRAAGIRTSAIRAGRGTTRGARSLVAAIVFTALCVSTAVAQDWPTKAIRAIVPLTAGSATDMIGRTVLDQLSQQLGQPIVMENRPGAGNTIGMATAARSDADGYTLLINSSSHTIVPATYGNLPFDTLRDFMPVIPLGNMPTVLVVSPSKGYKNLADFVAAAKAKPGLMNYSTAGAGNFSHFASEVFRRAAGFQAVHVPSKGAPEALMEVLADRVDFFFAPLIVTLPFLKDGRLQALAVSGSQRAAALPNVPTTVEADFRTRNIISGSGFRAGETPLPSWTSFTLKHARRWKVPRCRRSLHAWARTRYLTTSAFSWCRRGLHQYENRRGRAE